MKTTERCDKCKTCVYEQLLVDIEPCSACTDDNLKYVAADTQIKERRIIGKEPTDVITKISGKYANRETLKICQDCAYRQSAEGPCSTAVLKSNSEVKDQVFACSEKLEVATCTKCFYADGDSDVSPCSHCIHISDNGKDHFKAAEPTKEPEKTCENCRFTAVPSNENPCVCCSANHLWQSKVDLTNPMGIDLKEHTTNDQVTVTEMSCETCRYEGIASTEIPCCNCHDPDNQYKLWQKKLTIGLVQGQEPPANGLPTIKARLVSIAGEVVAEINVPSCRLEQVNEGAEFVEGPPEGIEYGGIVYLLGDKKDNEKMVYHHAHIFKL